MELYILFHLEIVLQVIPIHCSASAPDPNYLLFSSHDFHKVIDKKRTTRRLSAGRQTSYAGI